MAKWLDRLIGPTDMPDEGSQETEKPKAAPAKSSEGTATSPKVQLKAESQSEVLFDQKKIRAILPLGEYTIVQLEDRLVVIDERGQPVRDFEPKSSTEFSFRWMTLASKKNKSVKYLYKGSSSSDDFTLHDVPSSLKTKAGQLIGSNGYINLSNDMETSVSTEAHICVSRDGSHIFSSSDGEVFVSYKIRKGDTVLPPRMWERDTGYVWDDVPEELKIDLGLLRKSVKDRARLHIVSAEKGHVASIDDNGITIVAENDRMIFSDNVQGIGTNLTIDPRTPSVIYYCRTKNPTELLRIDMSGDPEAWKTESMKFPKKIEELENLKMDPSGLFFHGTSHGQPVMFESDTLEPIECKIPLTNVVFDEDGKVRGINSKGQLEVCETNLKELGKSIDARKAATLAAGIDVAGLFGGSTKKTVSAAPDAAMQALQGIKSEYELEFFKQIGAATNDDDLRVIRAAREKLVVQLRGQGLPEAQVKFITENIDVRLTEQTAAINDIVVQGILTDVRGKIAGGVSIALIGRVNEQLSQARQLETVVSPAVRRELNLITDEVQGKSQLLFHTEATDVQREMDGMIETARNQLENIDRQTQFNDWYEFEFTRLKDMLLVAAQNCPLESREALSYITHARIRLQGLADTYGEKFRTKMEEVRERAASQTQQMVDTLKDDIHGLIERMHARAFTSRDTAEAFLQSSPAYRQLSDEIGLLANRHTDASQDLRRTLENSIENYLYDIERGGNKVAAVDGRNMEMFGDTPFPIFEAPVAKTQPKKTTLTFDRLKNQPAGPADQLWGDVAMRITTSHGKEQTLRAWEGLTDEADLRYGTSMFHGMAQPSYMQQKDFLAIKKNFAEWKKPKGGLKEEYMKLRQELQDHYRKRKPVAERGGEDDTWQEEHRQLLEKFSTFMSEKRIPLLRRLGEIERAPEPEYANGSGFIPEWQNHWVVSPEDEKVLENMATFFKMQLTLQEGMLNLKGHAGTGKDVYLKMFAERTRRPYFVFDCTKWTTEADLSADIILEAENGASKTVEIPSAVVTAMQTPGAIIYFNEFNAMPDPARIFLHSLLDEKRSMTLKTRSGQVVKTLPSVLIASSMNPGYDGTTPPQMATRSRIVDLEVGYPPLQREPEAGDTNPNKPYSVSEALKIARGVQSLEPSTRGRNMKRNTFVQWWDAEINGIGDAPPLTATQRFDMQATFMLVQLSHRLREEFATFKALGGRSMELRVDAPITLREMRRCAYMLGEMTDNEKVAADPEVIAKALVETFFLSHFDNAVDRDKIKTAMGTWSLKAKRTV